jgi:hypothetical protein
VEKPKQGIFIPARPGQYIETAPPGKVPPAAPPALSSQWAILDLAERYLNAAADVKKARSRIARLKKDTRAAAQKDLDEAEIELERADYHQKLLAKFMRDALDSARADAAAAETAHARAAELYKQRLIGQPQVEAAKARADDALRLMKQLESVLSDMGLMPTGSAPKKGPQEITPELAELAARYVADKKSDAETIDALYKAVLGRAPTDAERAFGIKSLASAAKDRQAALLDIVYALISSKDARPSKPR